MSGPGVDDASAQIESLSSQLGQLTDALVSANDQLLALYQLAGFSAGSLDAEVAADRALSETRTMIGAESAAFVVQPPARAEDGPGPVPATDRRSGPDPERLALAAGLGPEADELLAAAGRQGVVDRPLIGRDLDDGRGQLFTPVRSGERFFGTIVARSPHGRRFTTADLKLLDAVANHLAVILEMSVLHEAAVHQALVQRDHDTASALAQAALDRALPDIDHLDVAASSMPARSAGGDFYAVGRARSGMYLALGDVSGKGLPAALVMTTAISATQGAFERHPDGDAGAVMGDIDQQLADYLSETGMFVTLAVAHIDPTAERLQLTNAGQSPVAVVLDGKVQPMAADGPPIGVLDPGDHRYTEITFRSGDTLFIGSDGCTDQNGPDSTMFGEERVYHLVEDLYDRSADEILNRVLTSVTDHGAGCEQDDDLTAIVVRQKAKEAKPC